MTLAGHEVAVSASVGIATSMVDYDNAEDVLRDADIAMYQAKEHARGSYAVFDVEMHARAVTRLELHADLRRAMENDQFEVFYQPIVHLDAEGTDHFEAFVRWRHPSRGLVGPMDFLPGMESTGQMVTLGRWIIDEVCRQIAQWKLSYDGMISVDVNVSQREFWDAGLLPHILDCLRRHSLEPANLALEINANVILRTPDAAGAIVDALRAAGVKVQVDGIGTGTSSLLPLHRFSVDGLKIDRSFIHELDGDPRTAELVRAIIAVGEAFGVDVVGEGVETAAQLELLHEMGCRSVQGFWFTEAVDGAAAAQLLGHVLPLE
jgi:EAL domain-containing protein (putative c-di-GMP-specific phosphodiesterase class I)